LSLFTIAGLVLLPLLLLLAAIHLGFRAPRHRETGNPQDYGIAYREVRIPTVKDKRLYGWYLAQPTDRSTIIILHGWGGNAEMMLPLAIPLYHAGYKLLLFDARSHGRSDGDSFSSLPRFAEDLSCAADWLRRELNPVGKIVLLGHSVGAGAVLLAASRRSDIAAVISVAAFAHPAWMMRRYLSGLHLPRLVIQFILRYVEWVIGQRFDEIAPMHTLCRIQCPVLLVHGKDDVTVPSADALAIHKRCGTDLSEVILIDEAGHDSVDKIQQHGHQLVDFLRRYGTT
jgi:pimeloyl-ACP methyl ester carboxylesterase